ncbi:hypothetical protein B4589_009440 [Halolamina sp. CBA1230]|uniref:hypothetical protein n=1 Tax=Halolamina sp. CBA1230 TaxID=1853690 RepID=UPI00117B0CF3|nr:hypothetical protein [Halolamina sp. CBA1230]QKY20589.1 hypothetical protein B4589_009440 [Halolamina sp. CBA1230]
MRPNTQRAVGGVLVLLGVGEAASMALGRSLLWRAFCGPAPPGATADCLVPDAVRVVVLLGALVGVGLLARAG